jgi:hypothetical protein
MTVVAGAILLDGAVLTAAYRGSTPTTEHDFSFPWHGTTAVATSLMWGAAQALLVSGLIDYARRQRRERRLGRAGARLAVAGGVAFVAAHLVSALAYDASTDDVAAIVAITLFGIGTLALAAGLLTAGTATLRSTSRTPWSKWAPLALGAWMVLMIPLQFTAALVVAVAVYSLLVIAFGASLLDDHIPPQP